ncbi:hypothetical protein ACP43V_09245 [Vibrio genomosp. F10 str. 9ZC157]|uniref:PglD N-terminal domain-containing protein n=1 Tax=Vibrio genomosp. F10 str. ZF-129 TaxID=1187848 RepID=A0A1E5BDE0_9VIBR|nr:hypothetical protein [Vibrio genomosp. F10]OEE33122.1 hypothetical protein A1QO_10600 [Vibrio genomosp. F10 str. ZF-129]OEE95623.1 hypothetical protein A1QM_04600 [Vibrio genomosp. F10 str. 9ZC157]
MKKLIIFGTGKIAEAVSFYFNRDSNFEICAYVCDSEFIQGKNFLGKRVIATEDVEAIYAASECSVFVAVGYQGMNSVRTEKVEYFKGLGYQLANYASPNVKGEFSIGENSIVMDDAVIQPCVKIGSNVFIWGGAMIGHHAEIRDNCWVTGSCAIGGLVVLGNGSFVGLNATIANEVMIGKSTMIGAGTLCCRSINENSVLVAKETESHRLNSQQFIRLSSCFRT